MKRVISFFLVLILVVPCIFATAEEDYTIITGNESMPSGTGISLNTTYASSLLTEQVVYFRFTTPNCKAFYTLTGKNINLSSGIAGSTYLGLHLKILNSIREELQFINMQKNEEKSINFPLSPNTTYYLQAYHAWDTTPGNFKFNISYIEDSVGDTAATAVPVSLEAEVVGTMDGNDDVDYYAFTTKGAGDYRIACKNIDIPTAFPSGWYFKFRVSNMIDEELSLLSASEQNEQEVTLSLQANTTYYLSCWNPSKRLGSYKFSVSEIRPPADISTVTVSPIKNQIYTGQEIKPNLTITDGTNQLVEGTDYTLIYGNNINTGKATVTINGIGQYTGTKNVNFIIIPKKMSQFSVTTGKKKLTVDWTAADGDVSGYEIEYSLKKGFKSAKKVTISNANTTSKVLKKLVSKKTYYVRIRAFKKIDGIKYYSDWSRALHKKVK